jgi:cyanophycinase
VTASAGADQARRGPLALVGGDEWSDGCTFDAELLDESGGGPVVVLPTASAYEQPAHVVDAARRHFAKLGADVVAVDALDRHGALDPGHVASVRAARFLYLASGSAMHLLSVLKRTPLWEAVVAAHDAGAVLAAAGSSAAVLCDAMVDPRGGGFGVGLGLVTELTLIPRYDQWSAEKSRRTIELAPSGLALAGLPERTALIREPDGRWREAGAGEVRLFIDGQPAELSALGGAGARAAG